MSDEYRYTCSICGVQGVNRRTCLARDWSAEAINYLTEPGLGQQEMTRVRRAHENLVRPKVTNASQPSTAGWGSLVPEVGAVEIVAVPSMDPVDEDEELMSLRVAVNEMAKDLRELREMFEIVVLTLI